MLARLTATAILSLALGSCGSGLGEGADLTREQKFLLGLQGTWIGTADSADTVPETDRIVFEMNLSPDGKPSLDGLKGYVWFGDELDTSPVDPDDPGVDREYVDHYFRVGHRFELLDLAVVSNRFLARLYLHSQWKEFCEAQTEVYPHSGMDQSIEYHCVPDTGFTEDMYGNCIMVWSTGEEMPVECSKIEVCCICDCDSQGCTIEVGDRATHELDVNVDIENGVMAGTGSLGYIEAVKQ